MDNINFLRKQLYKHIIIFYKYNIDFADKYNIGYFNYN